MEQKWNSLFYCWETGTKHSYEYFISFGYKLPNNLEISYYFPIYYTMSILVFIYYTMRFAPRSHLFHFGQYKFLWFLTRFTCLLPGSGINPGVSAKHRVSGLYAQCIQIDAYSTVPWIIHIPNVKIVENANISLKFHLIEQILDFSACLWHHIFRKW